MIEWIGFDADDTLWHNETLFHLTQERYVTLLSAYHPPTEIERKLFATEMRNLKDFGYGIKGFTLSMIETAIELTEGRIPAAQVREVLEFGRAMMRAPVELLEHARETVETLHESYPLLLVTKGDLFDQESKIARSGLSRFFRGIEILTAKTPEAYRDVLERYGIAPGRFLMVGNSLKSDVLPVLAIGGQAAHVEYPLCWEHEKVTESELEGKPFHRLASLADLPALVAAIGRVCSTTNLTNSH
ncbi:MAG: HAD family hydrolase [Acidobacteria bacterium]|nr:HAD family hydrolase [Acidobacteriota bacterium]